MSPVDRDVVWSLAPESFASWPWQRCLARHSFLGHCDRRRDGHDLHVREMGMDRPAWREVITA